MTGTYAVPIAKCAALEQTFDGVLGLGKRLTGQVKHHSSSVQVKPQTVHR